MRAPSSRPVTVALVVAALAALMVAGRLLSSMPDATPPATSSPPTAGPVRLPDLIGQPLAQASTVLRQMGLKAMAMQQRQLGLSGAATAIVIWQDPRAGERAPSSGVVKLAAMTNVQPNNTPHRVRLGAGPATAAYPIAVPGTAAHQLTVLVAMPAAASVAVWLEPRSDRRLPVVASTQDATACQPTDGQVHCRAVFAALEAEESGLWRVRLAKRSARPVDVEITVAVAPR
jgi:hypothetical protein